MKTRSTERTHAKNYLEKASECKRAMEATFSVGDWSACVINAVHCAISSADAVCVHKLGLRSASTDHQDAIKLFHSIASQNEDIRQGTNHLSRLLSIKADAEYGENLSTQREAEEAMKHADRLYRFAKSVVESPGF